MCKFCVNLYGDMNVEFWKKHQNTPLEEAKKMINKSHKDVLVLAEKFSNDETFSYWGK